MNHRHLIALLIALLAFSSTACGGEKAEADNSTANSSSEVQDQGQDQAQDTAEAPPEPAAPVEFCGAHILIQYQGSMRASAEITRSKEEALKLAQELTERARKGEDFAALAKEYSDGPSGPNGGNLGVWQKGRMVPEFDTAMESLEIGGISDPVETQFGYHVILRKPVEKVYCRHILVMHQQSMRKPPQVERTKEEALARAEEALAKAKAGEDFEDLAREYSDGPSGPRGGDLGGFGRGAMVPPFEEAAFGLDVGGISDIVETDFGYHIIQRYK